MPRTAAKRAPRKTGSIRRTPAPFDAGTMAELLRGADVRLTCSLIPEPQLLFGDRQPCEDPRIGLTAYGPYSKTDVTRRPVVRIGIVGPSEAIDRATHLIEQMGLPIPHHAKSDAMLHPGFPGINDQHPFQVEFVTQDVWCRSLSPAFVAKVEGHPDFTVRIRLLIDQVASEVEALARLDTPPDLVLIAMTSGIEAKCRVGIAVYDQAQREVDDDEDEPDGSAVIEELAAEGEEADSDEEVPNTARSFRRGLKAACMHLLPTQLLWHRTLAGTRGVQDLATRAWNLSVALMYKAKIIPWRLADIIEGSCFVGISFFHPDDDAAATRTSIAQAFTHRGEGFVLQGSKFNWRPTSRERAPHLDRANAKELLERVLKIYKEETDSLPRRLVVHKTSRYTKEEREGFGEALQGVAHTALVTLSRRGIVCLRPGTKPVLRGTAIDFGEKTGLVYTTGYVPFLRCYPGFRIPQPLEVTENWGSLTFREVAVDLLRLTKLNWNTAAFACVDPITIAFSRRVGEILKIANTDNPSKHYRQYM